MSPSPLASHLSPLGQLPTLPSHSSLPRVDGRLRPDSTTIQQATCTFAVEIHVPWRRLQPHGPGRGCRCSATRSSRRCRFTRRTARASGATSVAARMRPYGSGGWCKAWLRAVATAARWGFVANKCAYGGRGLNPFGRAMARHFRQPARRQTETAICPASPMPVPLRGSCPRTATLPSARQAHGVCGLCPVVVCRLWQGVQWTRWRTKGRVPAFVRRGSQCTCG